MYADNVQHHSSHLDAQEDEEKAHARESPDHDALDLVGSNVPDVGGSVGVTLGVNQSALDVDDAVGHQVGDSLLVEMARLAMK